MSSKIIRVALISSIFILTSTFTPAANAAPADDACALLTPAQVAAGAGVPVNNGVPILPTDHKVCTWNATKPVPKSTKFVTLLLENLNAFQAGKSSHMAGIVITPVSGVGDDAYYLAVADNAGLIVKKGNLAFKVAVYADLPLAAKEAMEKTLALQILSKL